MGKSAGVAAEILQAIRTPPFTNVFYLTLTLKNAKRIIWPWLKMFNDKYNLGGKANESEGYLSFPELGHDVHAYLGGVKDANEVEKVRGPKCKKYFLDEAQLIPPRIIQPLMKDVINPALLDVRGSLVVSGTPAPLRAGYFWDVCHGSLAVEWEQHNWTWRDNPWIQPGRDRDEIEEEILKENKLARDSPTFLREWCGQWFQDDSVLVFKYAPERNAFEVAPERMTYVIGVDLGFDDADAIAVLGWTQHDPTVYLVEEYTQRKQGMTPLMDQLKARVDKYRPIRVVMDLGGLGKKGVEDFRPRFAVQLEAADKQRKFEHIEILNDAMRLGTFKARPNGPFAEDAALVQWDQDARAEGRLKIAEDYHSDITDAVLYAYRTCYGYLSKPPPPPPKSENDALVKQLYAQQQRARDPERDPWSAALGFED